MMWLIFVVVSIFIFFLPRYLQCENIQCIQDTQQNRWEKAKRVTIFQISKWKILDISLVLVPNRMNWNWPDFFLLEMRSDCFDVRKKMKLNHIIQNYSIQNSNLSRMRWTTQIFFFFFSLIKLVDLLFIFIRVQNGLGIGFRCKQLMSSSYSSRFIWSDGNYGDDFIRMDVQNWFSVDFWRFLFVCTLCSLSVCLFSGIAGELRS